MLREQCELLIEGRDRGFEHLSMCRRGCAGQIGTGPGTGQLERLTARFNNPLLRRHRRLDLLVSSSLFLLSFDELRIESSRHPSIVRLLGCLGTLVAHAPRMSCYLPYTDRADVQLPCGHYLEVLK